MEPWDNIQLIYSLIKHTAFFDYTPIDNEEITFDSGQTVNSIQCFSVSLIDDTVLEDAQSFQVALFSFESFIIIPMGQDSLTITINEDPHDGRLRLDDCMNVLHGRLT